jgi:gluconate 5-dehydrogenase
MTEPTTDAEAGPLDGQVALVTGGSSGIGRAIAVALLSAGAQVAIADRAPLREADGPLADGSRHSHHLVDLIDPAVAEALPHQVAEQHGRLDIVVNNAGRRGIFAFTDYPLSDWADTFALNLTAPFLICREAAKLMVPRGGGSIVNVTSVAAELGFTRRSAYNSSKAGLVMLTKSIALELGASGIRCNAVSPGIIETPLNSDYLRDAPESEAIIAGTPVGHWGQPEDIAAAVTFLASPAARFINGTVVNVDGGWTTGKGY